MKVLKIAIRSLMHFKWYTAINIVGLALSLACVIVIFRYVYGEITVDRYIPDLDRVYVTMLECEDGAFRPSLAAIPSRHNQRDFKNILKSPTVEVWTEFTKNKYEHITANDKPYIVAMIAADSNYNRVFGLPILSGTLDLANPRNAAITVEMSRKIFGDEDPLGMVIKLSSGYDVTVTAVIDELSTTNSYLFDLLVSHHISRSWDYKSHTAAKLYPKQDYKQINEQYSDFFASFFYGRNENIRFQLFPYKDIYLRDINLEGFLFELGDRTNVFLLFGMGVLILLVGVANFINIYLAVAMRRGREWGMKKVFGARGPHFFIQIWVENLLLVGMSLLIALSITEMVSPLVKNLLGLQQLPFIGFDFALVGIFFVALPLLTTIIPFFKFTYSMPIDSLRSIGKTGGRGITRRIFLALQYTITIFMIVIAVFFNRQLRAMLNVDPGFRTENIIIVNPLLSRSIDRSVYEDAESRENRQKHVAHVGEQFRQCLNASPLIEKWTFGYYPTENSIASFNYMDGEAKYVSIRHANQKWMELLDIELIEGRLYDDRIDQWPSCGLIVSESTLPYYGIDDWRTAALDLGNGESFNIVGIVKDYKGVNVGYSSYPTMFAYKEGDVYDHLLVSFREGDKQQVIELLRELHDETVGGEFVYSFLDDIMKEMYKENKKVATVFTIFTMIAILISVMGLFSMSLFDIEQRYNEIAIRKVNGATTGQIISMLLRKYVILLGIAFLIAAPAAWFVLTKYLENFAFKTPISWWIFALALLVTAGVSLLTLIVQTKKAAETNPASVIRNE